MRLQVETEPLAIQRRPLFEEVETILRRAILSGRIKPGHRIPEVEIAAQLQVSRGPVREALSKLQQEGLVSRKPHRGAFVTTLSRHDAQEIYSLRALLEGEAAALAVDRMTPGDFARLRDLLQAFGQALQDDDVVRMVETDRLFHGTVIEVAGHGRLMHACRNLDSLVGACYLTVATAIPDRKAIVVERHRSLVDVLQEGGAEAARQAFTEHYLDSWDVLTRVLPEDKETEP